MNENIKSRWVAALRSGNYSQARGRLESESHYCCLGVLCEIAVKDNIVDKYKTAEGSLYASFSDPIDRGTAVLPIAVMEWAGLPTDDPNPAVILRHDEIPPSISKHDYGDVFLSTGDGKTNLASLNDNGATFEEIADIIEKKF